MDNHQLIGDMRDECECQNCEYCPLEVLITVNPRMFEQHKLVEKFKIERSDLLKRDLGWNGAYILWKDERYAEYFAKVYKAGLTHKELQGRIDRLKENHSIEDTLL